MLWPYAATNDDIQRYMTQPITTIHSHPAAIAAVASAAVFLAFAPPIILAWAAGGALLLALALCPPVLGLYLAVLSVPVQATLTLPGGQTLTQICVALLLVQWLRSAALTPQHHRFGRLLPFWAMMIWALVLATGFTVYAPPQALRETARWGVAALVGLLAVDLLRTPRQWLALALCLLAAPTANALVGLWQFASGAGPPTFKIAAGLPFVRAYGTTGQPNSFAGYLNMGWPLALALAIGGRGRLRIFAAICTLVLLAALAASFSRGGWLGAAVGALALGAASGRRAAYGALGVVLAGALVLGLGAAGVLPGPIGERVGSIVRSITFVDPATTPVTAANFAVVERTAQLVAGARMLADRPLTGVGPGNYTPAYGEYQVGPWYASRGHAHNFYLHIGAEAGILGMLAYGTLLGAVFWRARAALRRVQRPALRALVIGCCGVCGAVAGHNLFENLHVLNLGIQLAAVWAVLDGLEDN